MRKILICLLSISGLVACNGGSSSSSGGSETNLLLSCLPSVPANSSAMTKLMQPGSSLKIYGGCNTNESAMSLVQQMTVALSKYNSTTSAYSSACSATPIKSTANGNGSYTNWVLTAAHCFEGGSKAANAPVTADNFPLINLPNDNANVSIFSGISPFAGGNNPLMTIESIFVPADYCYQYAFNDNGQCGHTGDSSHDIALLKTTSNTPLDIVVQLASEYPSVNSLISQSGYGRTTAAGSDYGTLFYDTAYYMGHGLIYSTNGDVDQLYTVNDFSYQGGYGYVGTTCHGDSGSGVFYYQNNQWYVFGDLAALRTNYCGTVYDYNLVQNISDGVSVYTDVIKFKPWIESIIATDSCTTNCVESSI